MSDCICNKSFDSYDPLGLHLLWKRKKMLHQDISIGNLAYYRDENGKVVAVLLDFDLASMPGSRRYSSKHRTGTAPFMAREVLDSNNVRYMHKIYHDLESLFYALVWHAVGYRGTNLPPQKGVDPLKNWRTGDVKAMLNAKKDFFRNEDALDIAFDSTTESSLYNKVRRVWDEYHNQYELSKKDQSQMDIETRREHAKAVQDEVLARTGDEDEAEEAFERAYARLSSNRTILEGLGITFKKWMAAANARVEDEHAGCNCCF